MTAADSILEVKGLSKSFPGVMALEDVNFSIRRGEIHALMGENGAGKSTLIKVITGLYKRDRGDILLDEEAFEINSPVLAPRYGISTVYQEINLIPTLSVAENIFLGRQPLKRKRIDWNTMRVKAEKALTRLDIEMDVTNQLSECSIAQQQMVSIARSLDISAKILIFDEPTSCLDISETRHLFDIMRKLRDTGVSIIFITHFIDQVYEVSDRITVLRNGKIVGVYETGKLPKVELIAKMLGRKLAEFEFGAQADVEETESSEKFIELRGYGHPGYVLPIDLVINKGEVLGFAGLLGSGRTETAKLLFGIIRAQNGELYINGEKVVITSTQKAITYNIGLCPEDRKAEGLISGLTVRENIILAIQAQRGVFNLLSRKQQDAIVSKYIKALRIVTPSSEQLIDNLSGGNQQKVIVARWLASEPELLILDEPTRGIDVGAKAEIQKLIIDLSREGMAILFISSLLDEVVRCSDRVVVMRDKKKIGELKRDTISAEAIMHTIAEGGM